jgi:hypothetical protein
MTAPSGSLLLARLEPAFALALMLISIAIQFRRTQSRPSVASGFQLSARWQASAVRSASSCCSWLISGWAPATPLSVWPIP